MLPQLPDAPTDTITDAAADYCTTFPVKVAGKQWTTLHSHKTQTVYIYTLNGTLLRTAQLQKDANSVWTDEPSIIIAK